MLSGGKLTLPHSYFAPVFLLGGGAIAPSPLSPTERSTPLTERVAEEGSGRDAAGAENEMPQTLSAVDWEGYPGNHVLWWLHVR